MATMPTIYHQTIEKEDEQHVDPEEKALLIEEGRSELATPPSTTTPAANARLSTNFWLCASINTAATAGIIFVNKHIFSTQSLRHAQLTFAAFHFATTSCLLYILSRPSIALFPPKRVTPWLRILPLASGMIFNVVLPNASLAYSSIQFYQIMRVLVTPCVCALNFVLLGQTTHRLAVVMLVPVCVGVGVMSWFDTAGKGGERETGMLGVVFAITGVLATSIYTVWIKMYHGALECTSMQLLLNQAPMSVLLMLYLIPFADDVTVWRDVGGWTYALIVLSGVLACAITVTQFVIISEAGAVSSTVVGHFKTCLVILLSWIFAGKSFNKGSAAGIVLALGGIISYSAVTHRRARK